MRIEGKRKRKKRKKIKLNKININRGLMMSTPLGAAVVDQKVRKRRERKQTNLNLKNNKKELVAKRAEKKKLEIKWEATKGLRNEYKSKV
jgi:hypothetical protein